MYVWLDIQTPVCCSTLLQSNRFVLMTVLKAELLISLLKLKCFYPAASWCWSLACNWKVWCLYRNPDRPVEVRLLSEGKAAALWGAQWAALLLALFGFGCSRLGFVQILSISSNRQKSQILNWICISEMVTSPERWGTSDVSPACQDPTAAWNGWQWGSAFPRPPPTVGFCCTAFLAPEGARPLLKRLSRIA